MTFLPIVGRELRVASRKRSTFWVRIAAALVALVIGSGFLILTLVWRFGLGGPGLGKGLFATLTWLSLAAALSAGLFFTSDCLSEEKREGTIGFLFLTDLSGYDVVLGKLLATSLRAFYALLAVFPIVAVTLLMGGVTGAQFWKTALALVNALFLSLSVGLFVSAISRDSQKALAGTLLLLVLLVAAGPIGDGIFAAIKKRPFDPVLSLSSPGYLFVIAGAWGRAPYWSGLLVNQAIAWTLLGLSCLLLPRTWQEKAARGSTAREAWAHWWKFGGLKRRLALRTKLLGANPVLWLACRERWQMVVLWAFALLTVAGAAALSMSDDASAGSAGWFMWNYLGGLLTLLLYLGITSQACRFFVDVRRSGLIELLLCTPLAVKEVVQGQYRALLRMFGLALVLYLAAQLLATVMYHMAWYNIAATTAAAIPPTPPPATAATNATNTTIAMTNTTVVTTTWGTGTPPVSAGGAPGNFVMLLISLGTTLTVAANVLALIWFGMWMGLTSKNTNLATLKTLAFVQIIPWFAVTFASWMIVPMILLPSMMKRGATAPAQIMAWYPLIMSGFTTVLYLTKDIIFVLWSRRKLYTDFRERAAQVAASVQMPLPLAPPRLPA